MQCKSRALRLIVSFMEELRFLVVVRDPIISSEELLNQRKDLHKKFSKLYLI